MSNTQWQHQQVVGNVVVFLPVVCSGTYFRLPTPFLFCVVQPSCYLCRYCCSGTVILFLFGTVGSCSALLSSNAETQIFASL